MGSGFPRGIIGRLTYTNKAGIEWFASAWDVKSQEFLRV